MAAAQDTAQITLHRLNIMRSSFWADLADLTNGLSSRNPLAPGPWCNLAAPAARTRQRKRSGICGLFAGLVSCFVRRETLQVGLERIREFLGVDLVTVDIEREDLCVLGFLSRILDGRLRPFIEREL